MLNQSTQDLDQEQAFIDAGFTKEQVGSVTMYKACRFEDVIEASIWISVKRQIGYTSKDFTPRPENTNKE